MSSVRRCISFSFFLGRKRQRPALSALYHATKPQSRKPAGIATADLQTPAWFCRCRRPPLIMPGSPTGIRFMGKPIAWGLDRHAFPLRGRRRLRKAGSPPVACPGAARFAAPAAAHRFIVGLGIRARRIGCHDAGVSSWARLLGPRLRQIAGYHGADLLCQTLAAFLPSPKLAEG